MKDDIPTYVIKRLDLLIGYTLKIKIEDKHFKNLVDIWEIDYYCAIW